MNLHSGLSRVVYRSQRHPRTAVRLLYRPLVFGRTEEVHHVAVVVMDASCANGVHLVEADGDGNYKEVQTPPIPLHEASSSPSAGIVELPGGTLLCSVYNFEYLHEIAPTLSGEYELTTQYVLPAKFRAMCAFPLDGTHTLFVALDDASVCCMTMGLDGPEQILRMPMPGDVFRTLTMPNNRLLVCTAQRDIHRIEGYSLRSEEVTMGAAGVGAIAAVPSTRATPLGALVDVQRVKVACWTLMPSRADALVLVDMIDSALL